MSVYLILIYICEIEIKITVCTKVHPHITRINLVLLNFLFYSTSQIYYNIHTIILQHLIH
nr:MAG TPA: hypothetical protein [Caudoviricetes sp.]